MQVDIAKPDNLITKTVEDLVPGITILKWEFPSTGRTTWTIKGEFSPDLSINISLEPNKWNEYQPITLRQVHIAAKNLQWILKDGRLMGFTTCLFHQEETRYNLAYSFLALSPKQDHPIWDEEYPNLESLKYWRSWGC